MTQSNIALQLGNITIRQHNGLFSLNDLHKAAGGEEKHQPAFFIRR
ncbi:MAG: KilA-N domain-containing protein, partial [Hyphomicrobiaceae bacterium]